MDLQLTDEQRCSPRASASCSHGARRRRLVPSSDRAALARAASSSARSRSAARRSSARSSSRSSRALSASASPPCRRRHGRAAPRRGSSSTAPRVRPRLGLAEPERSFAPAGPRRSLDGRPVRRDEVVGRRSRRRRRPRACRRARRTASRSRSSARAPGVELEPEPTLDPSHPRRQPSGSTARRPELVLAGDARRRRPVAAAAAVLAAAEAVGAAATVLALARDYAAQRRQFGHPIGSFQAVRHLLADMLVQHESSWSSVLYAAASLDEREPDSLRTAAIAKA